MMLPVFLLCTVMLASAQNTDRDEGEYGYYTTTRKSVCEKNDQELYEEIETCIQEEDQAIIHAIRDCAFVADPASNGDNIEFFIAACKNPTLFKKFDECFEEYENHEDFRILMEISDVRDCYVKVYEKYGIGTR